MGHRCAPGTRWGHSKGNDRSIRGSRQLAEGLERRVLLSGYSYKVIAPLYPTGSLERFGLTVDQQGDVFLCGSDSGTLFEVPAGTSALQSLGHIGENPSPSLTQDAQGNIFGTQNDVFEVVAGSRQIVSYARINPPDETFPDAFPLGGVIFDDQGNMYGAAAQAYGDNEIYEIRAGTQTIQRLASFSDAYWAPTSPLMRDAQGDLFGMTQQFGVPGEIYELPAGGHSVITLATFSDTTPPDPSSGYGLTLDSDGNLWGANAGNNGTGYIFELPKGSNTLQVIATLTSPASGVTFDGDGNLLGTTAAGTVYEIKKGTTQAVTIATDPGGAQWQATGTRLTPDGKGDFYGTTGEHVFELVPSVPTTMVITEQPVDLLALSAGSELKVSIVDAAGMVVSDVSSTVTLSIQSGPAGGQLVGTLKAPAVNGVATFKGVKVTVPGFYTLGAAMGDGSLAPVTSPAFDLHSNVPTHIGFVEGISDYYMGQQVPALQVAELDAESWPVDVSGDTITISEVGGALSGATTAVVSHGIATFTKFASLTPGTYRIEAMSSVPGIAPITSNPFEVLPVTATQIAFVTQPRNTVAGAATVVQVAEEDAYGHIAPTNGDVITLTDASGKPGSLTATTVNGIATFSNVSIYIAGSYSLKASASDSRLGSTPSNPFTITAGAAAKLVFGFPPESMAIGTLFGMRVAVVDAFGNLETTDESWATAGIQSGPAGAVLAGAKTLPGTGGTTTFNNLALSKMGTYRLWARAGNLPIAVSDPFQVTGAVAVLGAFNGANGADLAGRLAVDSQGNFYGTARDGGAKNKGVLYEIVKGNEAVRTLVAFDGTNGADPVNMPVMDKSGNL